MTTQTNRNRNRTPYRARARGGGQFVPAMLGHTALYDAHLGGSSTQVTDSSSNAAAALAFAASTAAPTFLAYDGTPYVWLPGVSGNTLTAPDSAALSVTGNLELAVRCALTDWTGAGVNAGLISKSDVSVGRSWEWRVSGTGLSQLALSADGSAVTTGNASTALTFTAGQRGWHKASWRASDGRLQFSTAADADAEPTYAQLGTDITVGVASIFDSNQLLVVGGRAIGTSLAQGAFTRAIVRPGASTTAVADFNAADCGQTGYTDSAGVVWTVAYGTSGLAAVVKSNAANDPFGSVVADGSNDYATGPTAAIPALTAADACTLYTVTRPRATMTTNMTFFSTRSGTGAGVTLRMASATTVVADISDGSSTVTTPAVTITPGTRYVLGVVVPTSGGAFCFANATDGSTVARTGNTETGGALTVFATSTPGNYCRTNSRVPFASVPYALSAGARASLTAYYRGGA